MKDKPPKQPPRGPRLVGYARVSSQDQNLDMQIAALANAGVHPDNVWKEHVSAVANRRPQLDMALADSRNGDTFVVWKLDRLARDLSHLLKLMKHFGDTGVAFKSLTEGIDTATPAGKLLPHVIGALAQFERDLIVERTKAGVAAHKARGGNIGQPAKIVGAKRTKAEAMLRVNKSVVQIAAALKCTPNTVYSTFGMNEIKRLRSEGKE